jgi:chitodextrinase
MAAGPDAAIVLSSNGASPAACSLAWTDPGSPFFQEYAVDESINGSGGPWTTVGLVTSAGTDQFAVSSLSPGSTYWWEIVESYGFHYTSTLASNVISTTQPTLAFLSVVGVTSTSATFQWTNNASYGGLVSFVSYQLFESVNGTTPGVAASLTSETPLNDTLTDLAAGTGYTFFLMTSDCSGLCGAGPANHSSTQSNSLPLGTAFPLVATISALRSVVDVGQPDYLTCTPSGGVAPFHFRWDFGNGTFEPGNGSVGTAFASPGTPVVRCEVVDGSSSESVDGITLMVNSSPQLVVSLNRTAADVGEATSFSCSPVNGTVPFSVGWTFGDGGSSAGEGAVHTYGAPGTFVATCSGSDGAGVPVAASSDVTVSPVLDVAVAATSAAAAPGTPLTFTAEASNGSGTYTVYSWTFGDGTVATGSSTTHAFSSVGEFAVKVRVTDSNEIAETGTLTVNVSPIAVTLLSDPTSSQAGEAVVFTASTTGGAGAPYNYTWSFGDGATAYGASVTHSYGSTGTYGPTVLVTDRLGAQNLTHLPAHSVTAASTPLDWLSPWLLLAIAVVLGALAAVVVFTRRRSEESESAERMSSYVPPTDPSLTMSGAKVCASCQTPNLATRNSCVACGKPLQRSITHVHDR